MPQDSFEMFCESSRIWGLHRQWNWLQYYDKMIDTMLYYVYYASIASI